MKRKDKLIKMKQIKLIALAVSLFFGINNDAQAQNQLKIGYVNVEYVLGIWPKVKTVQSELKTYETQLMNEVNVKQKEFQVKLEEYQRTAPTLSDAIKRAKEDELQSLQNQISLYQTNAQTKFVERQKEKLEPLLNQISDKINEVAKEKNYSHVFTQSVNANSILLYARDESDNLSFDVLKKLGVEVPKEDLPTTNQK